MNNATGNVSKYIRHPWPVLADGLGLRDGRAVCAIVFTYRSGMIVAVIEVKVIRHREQGVWSILWKGGEDGDESEYDSERERREEREEWYGSWPSEEDSGVQGGETRVCRARPCHWARC